MVEVEGGGEGLYELWGERLLVKVGILDLGDELLID